MRSAAAVFSLALPLVPPPYPFVNISSHPAGSLFALLKRIVILEAIKFALTETTVHLANGPAKYRAIVAHRSRHLRVGFLKRVFEIMLAERFYAFFARSVTFAQKIGGVARAFTHFAANAHLRTPLFDFGRRSTHRRACLSVL
jgi:hypothetical protein